MRIDLNSDLGEAYGPWRMGDDAAMLDLVSSANIACGGHASDPDTMFATLSAAAARGVSIGAHPGYADREGFGRRIIPMQPDQIARMVAAQVGSLMGVAAIAGAEVRYVKPHGALYNLASEDRVVAQAIVSAVAALPGRLAILAMPGSELAQAAEAAGLRVFAEIFADRGYLPDGRLAPRGMAGAVLHDPEIVARRLLDVLDSGLMPVLDGAPIPMPADSVCIHGDNPAAVAVAGLLRQRLTEAGVGIAPFLATS